MDVHSLVVECVLVEFGKPRPSEFQNLRAQVDEVDRTDSGEAQHFAQGKPIAAATDEHPKVIESPLPRDGECRQH